MQKLLNKRRFLYTVILLIIATIAVCVVSILFAPTPVYAAKSDFAAGKGTKDDPFLVSNVKEFNAIASRLDAYFVQTEDIDFTGEVFYPIGDLTHPFTGHYSGKFNGKQSIITGINADFSNRNNVGVFSYIYVGAVVEDIRIENSTFIGHQSVGSVAGINAGKIERAVVKTKVVSDNNAAGGVVGVNSGVISLAVNSGDVSAANMYSGGISGIKFRPGLKLYNKGSGSFYTNSRAMFLPQICIAAVLQA